MIAAMAIRFAGLLGVMLGISFIVFALGTLIPGDMATVVLGEHGGTDEEYEAIRRELGLDQPLVVQYLNWLVSAVQGDLGTSPLTGRAVTDVIAQAAPVSFEIALVSVIVATLIGVPIGILQAVNARKPVDVGLRVLMLLNVSFPTFFFGVILLLLTAQWFPALYAVNFVPLENGLMENLRSIALPVIGVSLTSAAMISQMTRTKMVSALGDPSIRTARALGTPESTIRYFHGLKNALPPVVTLVGYEFGGLLGALVVVEQVFSLPGLGRELLLAISQRDFPLIVGITCVLAASFVVVNMIVDVLYLVLDPRQRRS